MDDLTKKLRKEKDDAVCQIENPRTEDFTVGRTTLIPGCLKWLAYNKNCSVILIFCSEYLNSFCMEKELLCLIFSLAPNSIIRTWRSCF